MGGELALGKQMNLLKVAESAVLGPEAHAFSILHWISCRYRWNKRASKGFTDWLIIVQFSFPGKEISMERLGKDKGWVILALLANAWRAAAVFKISLVFTTLEGHTNFHYGFKSKENSLSD